MTTPFDELYERIAGETYLADLSVMSLDDLRARRHQCQVAEDRVSFVRRMVHGRLDVIRSERQRRADGSAPSDVGALVAGLPGALAEHCTGASRGRLARFTELDDAAADLVELDRLCPPAELAQLADLDTDAMARLEQVLGSYEARVSARRRTIFARLDALADELADRYRRGDASVESLLL